MRVLRSPIRGSVLFGALVLGLAGCDRAATDPAAPAEESAAAPVAAAPAPAVDEEFEQLKAATPVDACALLGADALKAVYPDQAFELRQEVKPQLSGYVWDSRCTWWAGVGSIDFAPDAPTHQVEIFVATAASAERAQRNLASGHELAREAGGLGEQPALGEKAYSTTDTGRASLFFVRGQSLVQINVSDLNTPSAERVRRALALAQAL